ncbi:MULTISPECIES: hypothetical protein [Mycobacteriaceae]|uniref:hypothetical protein n=1 Tax=Mycobacteriaceae TaxID=1762 RepID=UPI0008001BD0|nr:MULTISPECIES: hypothetical protein [Mycobacteriaceae]MCK0174271.1 hypothetical protein [Mycolicibacterium sp. F2034L]OBB60385.1 hypothetical protein A5757_09865 [Mycobacterium sp. 852013-51886_SCH5428379]
MRRSRRVIVTTLATLAAAGSLALGAPGAGAQPGSPTPTITVVPEQPADAATRFANNPAIVDSHPMAVQSWSRLPGDHGIAVQFTTGTPECYGVQAEVQETPDIVAVKMRSGTVPEAVGRACIAIGVVGTMAIPLQSPLGHRAVVSIT